MVRNELINLIRNSFSQGKKEVEIERSLNLAGWVKGDVKDTINFTRQNYALGHLVSAGHEKERISPVGAVVIIGAALLIGEIFSRLAGFSFIFRLFT